MSDLKLCIHCKHFDGGNACTRLTTVSPVNGVRYTPYVAASDEREDNGSRIRCGPEAKHFEPIPPPPPRLGFWAFCRESFKLLFS